MHRAVQITQNCDSQRDLLDLSRDAAKVSTAELNHIADHVLLFEQY
jgi:hypothetical protein